MPKIPYAVWLLEVDSGEYRAAHRTQGRGVGLIQDPCWFKYQFKKTPEHVWSNHCSDTEKVSHLSTCNVVGEGVTSQSLTTFVNVSLFLKLKYKGHIKNVSWLIPVIVSFSFLLDTNPWLDSRIKFFYGFLWITVSQGQTVISTLLYKVKIYPQTLEMTEWDPQLGYCCGSFSLWLSSWAHEMWPRQKRLTRDNTTETHR